jgi:hypothetical protein
MKRMQGTRTKRIWMGYMEERRIASIHRIRGKGMDDNDEMMMECEWSDAVVGKGERGF